MSITYTKRPTHIQAKIRQLSSVLPYPMSWYESLSNTRIEGIYRSHLSKVISAAILADENEVRRRAGLPTISSL